MPIISVQDNENKHQRNFMIYINIIVLKQTNK